MNDMSAKLRKAKSEKTGRHPGGKKRRRKLAAGSGVNLQVRFVAKDNGAYEMWVNGKKVNELVFNKDKVQGMKKVDFFVITFTLDDQTTANDLEVPPNPMDAIWICTPRQIDPPVCPNMPVYDQQIYALSTNPSGKSFVVRNEDRTIEPFMFAVRFLHSGQDPSLASSYALYDPGGQNMNGGTGLGWD